MGKKPMAIQCDAILGRATQCDGIEWNNLDVRTSLIEEQIEFKNTVKKTIPNPFAKVL